MKPSNLIVLSCLALTLGACGGDDAASGSSGGSEDTSATGSETNGGSGETDGDSMTGDGDGDTGDGDGDTGDGDGDTGDGDGDTGDGDGDPGDGDGDPGDGDGDGDGDPGDGDGDPGDGDGDGDPGACMDNGDCMGANCVMGSCEVVATCLELEQLDPNLPSGVYELDHDGVGGDDAYPNYCDLETDGGGWTLVLKANGGSPTFAYESGEWTLAQPFQQNNPDLDRNEAKLPSWQWVDFTTVMVGMEAPIGMDPDDLVLSTLTIDQAANSLYDLISPGNHVASALGRNPWLGLMQGSDLQPNCDLEGFNVVGDDPNPDFHHVRIGIIGNNEGDCASPDSRLGIGGAGNVCNTLPDPTGNFVGCNGNNNPNNPAFGVVFVR